MTPGAATAAMQRSAELRGLLSEIAREHGINRALMRQELTFLSHLTRLIGQEPEARYGRPRAAPSQLRSHCPARVPGTRPPGVTPYMPISSFYGMQTSLRGLIAQQRMLDTTGHNIANASTKGYSRQEALLSASPASRSSVAGSATSSHLGSGVDVEGFRRVRDQFLDAQYRGQNTNLADWQARAQALDSAELSLSEPGDTGINEQLTKFWKSWSDLVENPDNAAAKQAVVQQANALTDSIHSVRSQMVASQESAMGQYDAIAGANGEVSKIAAELAGLNKTISSFLSNGDSPNDLMDRRDLLLDQLSGYGQLSVEQLEGGSTNVSFVDGTTGTATRSSPTAPRTGPARPPAAGPPAARWADCSAPASPAARSTDI